jgi:acetyl esterase/lipase
MLDLNRLYEERVVYSIPGMEQARVREGLVYRTLEDEELKLDIYYPAGYVPGAPLPAVILVHGDWPAHIIRHSNDLGVYVSWAQLIAASGVIAVNFNHRSTERLTRVREAASDVAQLLGYVRYHADTLDIAGDNLCIWAFSAGTPVGMWAAMYDAPGYVRAIVAYYGVMNLYEVRDALAPEIPEQDIRDFSALHYLEQRKGKNDKIAPMLLAKAEVDSPHLNASIDHFATRAKALGAPVELLVHPHGRHGFDVLNDDLRSREIIKRTLDFVRYSLGTA